MAKNLSMLWKKGAVSVGTNLNITQFGAIVDPAPRPCLTLPSGLNPQRGTRRCLEKPKLTSASSKPLGQL